MNRQRRAYTLLEMMIVLVIIVAMFAIAWPRMRGMSGRAALREAAVDLKVALADARDEAVRGGQPVQFAYQIAPNDFDTITGVGDEHHPSPIELPYGIAFASANDLPADGSDDAFGLGPDLLSANQPDQELAATNQIGDDAFRYVTFFPDGRSTAAEIYLRADDTKEMVSISVRALTGGVKIGPVIRPDPEDQLTTDGANDADQREVP